MPAEPDASAVADLRGNIALQHLAADDVEEFFRLDESFHHGLLRLAGHERVWPTVVAAKGHLDRARRLGLGETSARVFTGQHAEVLDAVLDGRREEARRLMQAHLRAVLADMQRVRERSPDLFASDAGSVPTRRTVAVWD